MTFEKSIMADYLSVTDHISTEEQRDEENFPSTKRWDWTRLSDSQNPKSVLEKRYYIKVLFGYDVEND